MADANKMTEDELAAALKRQNARVSYMMRTYWHGPADTVPEINKLGRLQAEDARRKREAVEATND